MSEKDELFILIHSMDMNEKGYFKKFAGINGQKENSIYLRLFDCISHMEVYELSSITREFKGEKLLKHLTVTKFYLKNMIIRSLRNYHEEQEPELRNALALGDTHIMLKKGLLQSDRKKIQKEKQAALANEDFLLALQWMWYDDQWLHEARLISEMGSRRLEILREKEEISEKWLTIESYTFLKGQVANATIIDGRNQVKLLKQILRDPLLKPGKVFRSNKARYSYSELLARIYLMTDEQEKGITVLNEMIAWCDNPQNGYIIAPVLYFILHNLLLHFLSREKARDMGDLIAKCKRIISANTETFSAQQYNAMNTYMHIHETRLHLHNRQPDEALKASMRMEQYIRKNGGNDSDRLTLWVLQAIAFVGKEEYDKALDRLNRVLVAEHPTRNDLLVDAYLLNILVHISLDNYAIVNRQVTIARNFIKKAFKASYSGLKLATMLGKAGNALAKGDDQALRHLAPQITYIVDSEKIRRKDFIKDWLENRLGDSSANKKQKPGTPLAQNVAARGVSG